jgi:hypothetical protein
MSNEAEAPIFYERRDVYTGKSLNPVKNSHFLREPKPAHNLAISVGFCRRPCVCEGFEVCLHFYHNCGRSPIWPVLSARTEEDARQLAKDLRAHLRAAFPWSRNTEETPIVEDLLQPSVAQFAKLHGFENVHHIVWRRPVVDVAVEVGAERNRGL